MLAICHCNDYDPDLTTGKSYKILKEYEDGFIIEFLNDYGKKVLHYKNEFEIKEESCIMTFAEFDALHYVQMNTGVIDIKIHSLIKDFSPEAKVFIENEYWRLLRNDIVGKDI